eukprot:3571222-Lingulodinium_polyedra.AAC.1
MAHGWQELSRPQPLPHDGFGGLGGDHPGPDPRRLPPEGLQVSVRGQPQGVCSRLCFSLSPP